VLVLYIEINMNIHINKNVAALIVRLIVGAIFIVAGWMKVSDMVPVVQNFGQMGLAPFLAYFVAYAELIGGIMLVLGFYVELAALVLAVIMVVAIYLTRNFGFQVYSMPLSVLAGAVSILGTNTHLSLG